MYVADHLLWASLSDIGPEDEEFQVFSVELAKINPFDAITISSDRLPQLQRLTEQDPIMETLKATVLTRWPETREEVPEHVLVY